MATPEEDGWITDPRFLDAICAIGLEPGQQVRMKHARGSNSWGEMWNDVELEILPNGRCKVTRNPHNANLHSNDYASADPVNWRGMIVAWRRPKKTAG